jgi:DNA-binding response OmpR family regulator
MLVDNFVSDSWYAILSVENNIKSSTVMTKSKLAIIEDDAAIAAMYEFKLQNDGYHVRRADNGQTGLLLLEEFNPDLILLDIKMPIMNGDEMLEKLRSTEWGSNMRVIVLTNISRDEAPSGLRFLNVDRYLVKAHHTPKQVVDVVNEVLHGHRPQTATA